MYRFLNPTASSDGDATEVGELRRVDDDMEDNNSTALNVLEQWERINVAVMTLGKFQKVQGPNEEKLGTRGTEFSKDNLSGNLFCP